ncbi:hypothetical protein BCR43DRAFT_524892 [Syncephalastrum racemosum]|uniref:Uncharacterized protein n=1 Tax=Syncephalastrum racemosum TaxID=13706 RepID=A0A1X2HDJ9_SYNRA|nr:hypothetical protein BCR43DRAFT_524892 [Syncephalastrum racemosum]
MRTTFLAISAAVAVLSGQTFALNNGGFKPASYAEEEKPAANNVELTDAFADFHWSGNEAMAQETYTVNLEQPSRIQITDFKNRGDSFEIYDNDKLLGKTSEVEQNKDDQVFAATPEEALEDERYSKGTFDLEEGEHKITIKASGPYEAGTAAIRLIDGVDQNVLTKKKSKGGWGDDKKGDWDDDKKGDWDDDKKGGWGDKKGGWGDKKGDWDDDKEDSWSKKGSSWDSEEWDSDEKGGWGDDKKGGWGGKGGWDDDKKGGWDDDKKGGWRDDKKGGWRDDKKGGWGDDKKDSWGDDKKGGWGDKEDELDLSHTITVTKTHYEVQKPTGYPIKIQEPAGKGFEQ